MKSVAIMQPYFFPYIGYFQLIDAVDAFVLYDNVKYIESGWSNRNAILAQGASQRITLPVRKADHRLTYLERFYNLQDVERGILRPIEQNYSKAPQFPRVMPLIADLLAFPDANVARFNANAIERISRYLGIATRIVAASQVEIEPGLRAQERVIAIVGALGGDVYLNPKGGAELYDRAAFAERGIELRLFAPDLQPYRQFRHAPVAGLSIIDVLMFNPVEAIRETLWQSHCIVP